MVAQVLCSGIMTSKECVLPIEGNRPDGPLDTVVVDLNASIGQEELQWTCPYLVVERELL